MDFSPSVLLVTGGAGFIGSNFVRHVLKTTPDAIVVTLDKLTYAGSIHNLDDLPDRERHTFVEGDINDRGLVEKLLREHEIDTIVHFAAETHVDRSIAGPGDFIASNVQGTYNLLESARSVWLLENRWDEHACRFHHISTDEVYGSLGPDDAPFTESSLYAPNSPYSASKAASDHMVRAWHHTYGLPVTTSNCSNNYGPYQHDEKLIPTVIRSCLNQSQIPVYGDGSNVRDWLYVDDHCRGVLACIRLGKLGEAYNFGGLFERANIDIVRDICRLMDEKKPMAVKHESLIQFVSDRPGHDWRYAIAVAKAARELEWTPSESFESGIEKTVSWYLRRSG
ncbi:MAG: dTDP-glucose 4,6-dehydratase [Gammaproteobacteria bacterium]|nr:dTDP-glucose 4,6-dehydratase [Gammaproteobacteria bacterium]